MVLRLYFLVSHFKQTQKITTESKYEWQNSQRFDGRHGSEKVTQVRDSTDK